MGSATALHNLIEQQQQQQPQPQAGLQHQPSLSDSAMGSALREAVAETVNA
jgi:hypothetical protein